MRKSGGKITRKGFIVPALIVSLALAFILPGLLPGKTFVPSACLVIMCRGKPPAGLKLPE